VRWAYYLVYVELIIYYLIIWDVGFPVQKRLVMVMIIVTAATQ